MRDHLLVLERESCDSLVATIDSDVFSPTFTHFSPQNDQASGTKVPVQEREQPANLDLVNSGAQSMTSSVSWAAGFARATPHTKK